MIIVDPFVVMQLDFLFYDLASIQNQWMCYSLSLFDALCPDQNISTSSLCLHTLSLYHFNSYVLKGQAMVGQKRL